MLEISFQNLKYIQLSERVKKKRNLNGRIIGTPDTLKVLENFEI
jgi:hypothetical protein